MKINEINIFAPEGTISYKIGFHFDENSGKIGDILDVEYNGRHFYEIKNTVGRIVAKIENCPTQVKYASAKPTESIPVDTGWHLITDTFPAEGMIIDIINTKGNLIRRVKSLRDTPDVAVWDKSVGEPVKWRFSDE